MADDLTTEDWDVLNHTLFPYATRKFAAVKKTGRRFVHYTSAIGAAAILTSRSIWLRNASAMNDHSEVKYGLDCLVKAYNSDVGGRFKTALDAIFPGVSGEIETLFNGWMHSIETDTFLTSISEHRNFEDTHGRLSAIIYLSEQSVWSMIRDDRPALSEIHG
jgi:hypothetical protein